MQKNLAAAIPSKVGHMITIPGIPIPKPRMTQRDKWAKRPCVVNFFTWKDTVKRHTKNTLEHANSLNMVFYLPFPKSYRPSRRAMLKGRPHQQKPDLDNLVKSLMDSLFDEDCKIFSLSAMKLWDDGEGPRTQVSI